MMHDFMRTALAALMASGACAQVRAAVEVGGVPLAENVVVAGRPLQLNGAGVAMRLVFRIYAMGLYLAERKRTVQDVMQSDSPRRLVIVTLRDVSSDDFIEAVTDDAASGHIAQEPRVFAQMQELARAICAESRGLRKGDVLTMDWVPGTGTVVELNSRPLSAPIHGAAFYNALLGIWLGNKPVDPSLKSRLLGAPARPQGRQGMGESSGTNM